MKPTLSIIIYSLASGGAERVVSLLLPRLQEHYHVTLILMNSTIHYDIPQHTHIFYLDRSLPYESGILKLIKLPYLAWKYQRAFQNTDITLAFMNRPSYIAILARLLGQRGKIIISERAMPSMQYAYPGLQSWINKKLIRWLYPKADLIIANSYGNTNDLLQNFVPNAKITTIHNPIDIQMVETLAQEPVEDVVFDNTYTFITVGRLDAGKNHSLIIESFYRLNLPLSQLLIIGDGPLRANLQEQIKRLKLEHQVHLIGKKKNPFAYLAKSNCFVFGSNHEGFPNVILEALACELPIISTDCQSGPREILAPTLPVNSRSIQQIMHTEYGILVPLNNPEYMSGAMIDIYHDQALSNKLKRNAKMRSQDFNKDTILTHYIKAIDDITTN